MHRFVKALFPCSLLVLGSAIGGCRDAAEDADASEGELLPNAHIRDPRHDNAAYRRIAEYFASLGVDLEVSLDGFEPAWPLADTKRTVLNRVGTPVIYSDFGYFHVGFDVVRSDTQLDRDVLAPHEGLAVAFDWSGNKATPTTDPYSTILAIYDPGSHVITTMMHISALPAIVSATSPVSVTKGSPVGTLAWAPVSGIAAARLANTEVLFIDGAKKKLLDPARLFSDYTDSVQPIVQGIYLADAQREVKGEFGNGKVDVVVEAFDRDDHSSRNLEVSAIAFTIKDQEGNKLAEQPRCELLHLYDDLSRPSGVEAKDLIDFGTAIAAQQKRGGWPDSDMDNPARTFRYSLTRLAVNEDGRCTLKGDEDGVIDIANEVDKLDVFVTLWDAKGNKTEKSIGVARLPGSRVFTVGGKIIGLRGDVVLQNNGGDDLALNADGAFLFPKPVGEGKAYKVTVKQQPATQTCTVTNGRGTISGHVTDVEVTCVTKVRTIGGTVTGLEGGHVTLQNNGGDNLTITEDGKFAFPTKVAQGETYEVTVYIQPVGRMCTVERGSGTVGASNVTDVKVTCVPKKPEE
jgi:hypothetical protein